METKRLEKLRVATQAKMGICIDATYEKYSNILPYENTLIYLHTKILPYTYIVRNGEQDDALIQRIEQINKE